jgi:hypothetical protein
MMFLTTRFHHGVLNSAASINGNATTSVVLSAAKNPTLLMQSGSFQLSGSSASPQEIAQALSLYQHPGDPSLRSG